MNAFELLDAIEAIQKAKEELAEAFQRVQDGEADEDFLGALAILSNECAAFHELYEKESLEHPSPKGVAW